MSDKIEEKLNEIMKTIQVGFKNVDKKFEGIDKKFEGIDKKFEGIDKKFEGIDKKFEGIDKKIEDEIGEAMRGVKVGFDEFHEKMANKEDLRSAKKELSKDIQNLKLDLVDRYADKETVLDHETRITSLEEKVLL